MPPLYQLNLPIAIELANGQIHETSIILKDEKPTVIIPVPGKPTQLEVDPKFNMFRRLHRDHIPPMLNMWVTDQNRVLILADKSSDEDQSVYQPILQRIRSRELQVNIQRTD